MPTRDPHWPHRALDYESPAFDPAPAGFSSLQLVVGFFTGLVIPPLAIFVSASLGVRPLAIVVLVCSVVGINVIAFINFRTPGRRAFAVGLWIGFAVSVAIILLFFLSDARIT